MSGALELALGELREILGELRETDPARYVEFMASLAVGQCGDASQELRETDPAQYVEIAARLALGQFGGGGAKGESAKGDGGAGGGGRTSWSPIWVAVGASSKYAPAHEDCLSRALALPGVDVNLQDEHGQTALFHAAFKGAWRCVKVLLADHRIDVNLSCSRRGLTPLHAAGHPKCIELLLQAPGIKINKADNEGFTPLAGAANLGKLECLKLLLQADGIAVNKVDKDGWTPFAHAANQGHSKCMEVLLEDARVNVNQPDNEGTFPLWHACILLAATAMSNMGACDGRFDDHTDPIRGLVLLLRSRRVSTAALDQAIDQCKSYHPSERGISLAEAGGTPLTDWHLMARHVLPILQAEAKGQKRWCDWCFRVTPDQDLLLCAGCQQVGYCNKECCQKKGWAKASGEAMEGATTALCGLRHKDACAGMAAEAAKAKADKAADKDSSGGAGGGKAMKTKRNEKCPCGSGKLYKKCCI